jgi:glycosyltransferase involved in cell wall biosynthesis
MSEATVSVVIPLYNQAQWVAAAVVSALHQTRPPIEVIVIDDGSTDGGARELEALDPAVRVIRQENAGVARAHNAGFAAARGSHVAFLDSDDTWHPEKLELQIDALESVPGSCIAHCGLEVVNDDGTLIDTRLDGAAGLVADDLFLFRGWLLGSSSTGLVAREAFMRVEGYNPNMSCSADWDFNLRMAELGPVAFVPKPLVRYRHHEGGMHRNVDAMRSDMIAAVDAAVARKPVQYRPMRKRSLSKIHLMLSGSYLHSSRRITAVSHLVQAVALDPRSASYALDIVRRRMVIG